MHFESNNTNESQIQKISVIITAYNRIHFLPKAISSVLGQRDFDFISQIIVVSNKDFSFIENRNTIKIQKIIMEGTIGEFLAEAIELATGDIIAFLDDDDLWGEDKISRLSSVFSSKQIVFYHNLYSYIDYEGTYVKYARRVEKNNLNSINAALCFNPFLEPTRIRVAIERRADFNLSCVAIRKDLISKHIHLLRNITGATDGFFFWIAAISRGYLFVDYIKLTKYRVHALNISGTLSSEKKVKELQRQIRTFKILLSLVNSSVGKTPVGNICTEWLQLYKSEYEVLALTFNKGGKRNIVRTLIGIINNSNNIRNTLKYRAFGFGSLGVLNYKLARMVYEHFWK